ncbi:MAG: hypothetical protein WCH21_03985, partial [Bacteroidota bacterium]
MNPNFNKLKYFYFEPDMGNDLSGPLLELNTINAYKKNSCILLPYKNPQKTKPHPLFFEINKQSKVKFEESSFAQLPLTL